MVVGVQDLSGQVGKRLGVEISKDLTHHRTVSMTRCLGSCVCREGMYLDHLTQSIPHHHRIPLADTSNRFNALLVNNTLVTTHAARKPAAPLLPLQNTQLASLTQSDSLIDQPQQPRF